jgi:hypothetical protein
MVVQVRRLLALVNALLPLLSSAYAAEQCASRELVPSFGVSYPPNLTLDALHWSEKIPAGQTNFVPSFFRFSLYVYTGTTDRKWNIVFRDNSMRVLATMGPEDFDDVNHRLTLHRWTSRLMAPTVTADLLASRTSDVVIVIEQGIAYPGQSSDARLFSIQGPKESWTPLYDGLGSQIPKRAGDAVGMLVSSAEDPNGLGTRSWCCSGVMVGSDLMLTNWHCGGSQIPESVYWNDGVIANTLVDLSWDGGSIGRQYGAIELVMDSRELDFALVRVRPVVGAGGNVGGAVRAMISERPVEDNDPIFLIHHAQCQPKLLSSHCNVLSSQFHGWTTDPGKGSAPKTDAASKAPDFTHNCDSEPGSSGGPVFDEEGLLVGLHHLGFERDSECKPTDRLNKAVRITEIIKRIREEHPEVLKQLWLK